MRAELKFTVLTAKSNIQQFMQAADVFSPHKVLVAIQTMTLTVEWPLIDAEYIAKCQDSLKQALEKSGSVITFMGYQGETEVPVYFRPEVQQISNGKSWGMFHKFLKSIGYEVETNEYVMVTSCKRMPKGI